MTRILPLLIALAASACGPAPQPANPDTLPTPSGPPVAQQPEPQPLQPAPAADAAQWESAVSGPATSLRLVEGGQPRLALTCLPNPARLVANAPEFKPIGSEDRFSLGLGDEPVTLVADLGAQGGVTAEAPVPETLPQLLRQAKQITARYGTQQVGPVAAPPPQLIRAFFEACGKLR
nr:hypothetical protein [uncultured Sphingosinicella sp.]